MAFFPIDLCTSKAVNVIRYSRQFAKRGRCPKAGSEHLVLALISEDNGSASQVIKKMVKSSISERNILRKARNFVDKKWREPSNQEQKCDKNLEEIVWTDRGNTIMQSSIKLAEEWKHDYIGTEHFLVALIREGDGLGFEVLTKVLKIDIEAVEKEVLKHLEELAELREREEYERMREELGGGEKTTLAQMGTNLNDCVKQGSIDPVIGRKKELDRVIQILGRRRKSNPLLLGDPGVGKTALAEGLAHLIVNSGVSDVLSGKEVIVLDMGQMIAGTRYRGEFELRLKDVLFEIRRRKNILLVIDEIHTIIGAGGAQGAMDAANLLKPALARGDFQCMGATTVEEYKKYIEQDAALERRFQTVDLCEPSVDETIAILFGLREKYMLHHLIDITPEAINSAARFADTYIADRFLPDKAIDIIDEATSGVRQSVTELPSEIRELELELQGLFKKKLEAVQLQNFDIAEEVHSQELLLREQINQAIKSADSSFEESEKDALRLTEIDIAQCVSEWTGVNVNRVSKSEAERLLVMEDVLKQKIIGQQKAVSVVSKAIRRSRTGLKNPDRPIASFIFAGPTGVGKTEVTKVLAEYFFGAVSSMIRLDMSEYMERHTVSKLIGSPPGFVGFADGGQLTEAVRNRPYTIVLFDEIEKAHSDIFNILLQILDDGKITDQKGREVNFKNTMVILTSNIGAARLQEIAQRKPEDVWNEVIDDIFDWPTPERIDEVIYGVFEKAVTDQLKIFFRPELLNRLDGLITFRPLNKVDMENIVKIMMDDLTGRLSVLGIRMEATSSMCSKVSTAGYDPAYGARPLRRAMVEIIEDPLAEALLLNRIKSGDDIELHYKEPYGFGIFRSVTETVRYSIKREHLWSPYMEINEKKEKKSEAETCLNEAEELFQFFEEIRKKREAGKDPYLD
jgi:ATP-dependent Clp protease ATP-binding subunit ClpC